MTFDYTSDDDGFTLGPSASDLLKKLRGTSAHAGEGKEPISGEKKETPPPKEEAPSPPPSELKSWWNSWGILSVITAATVGIMSMFSKITTSGNSRVAKDPQGIVQVQGNDYIGGVGHVHTRNGSATFAAEGTSKHAAAGVQVVSYDKYGNPIDNAAYANSNGCFVVLLYSIPF